MTEEFQKQTGSADVEFGDLGDNGNLVKFFQAVLDKRDELEEDRTQQSLTAAVVASPISGQASLGILGC